MPKKKKGKKNKKDAATTDSQDTPEEVIPQLYCDLKEISYVLLILCSPTYEEKYPNIQLLYKIIEISIEILLSENKKPIQLSDKKFQKNINTKLNSLKETDFYKNYIRPYIEEYKTDIKSGIKNVFLFVNVLVDKCKMFATNSGESKQFSFKLLAFIGHIIKSVFNSIFNIPVLKFTNKFGSIFFNFFFPKPKPKSCGGDGNSYHPAVLIDNFIGDPCKDINTDEIQIACTELSLLESSKIGKLTEEIMDYNTTERGDVFSKWTEEVFNFFQSSDEGGDNEDLFTNKLKELDTLQICLNENGQTKTFNCNLEDDPSVPLVETPLDKSDSEAPSEAPSTDSVEGSEKPIATGGGIRQVCLDGGFSQFSHINKNIVYNHINHFTDTSSLKGIYMLHQYNKYLNSN